MSKAIKCDCCGKTTPEINPKYSRKKKFGWFEFQDDSQGGSYFELDICEFCWLKINRICSEEQATKDKLLKAIEGEK